MIVSPVIVDSGQVWSNVTSASGATSYLDVKANTQAIISQIGHTNSAAQSCVNYNGGGYSDWYLPALDEAMHINESRYSINRTLALDSNYTQLGTRGTLNYREEKIMTSTESGVNYKYFRFGLDIWDSGITTTGKTQAQYENYIRTVRSFDNFHHYKRNTYPYRY